MSVGIAVSEVVIRRYLASEVDPAKLASRVEEIIRASGSAEGAVAEEVEDALAAAACNPMTPGRAVISILSLSPTMASVAIRGRPESGVRAAAWAAWSGAIFSEDGTVPPGIARTLLRDILGDGSDSDMAVPEAALLEIVGRLGSTRENSRLVVKVAYAARRRPSAKAAMRAIPWLDDRLRRRIEEAFGAV